MPPIPFPPPKELLSEIDELGELQRQIDLMDPVVERHKALKEKLETIAKDFPADQPVVFSGKLYRLQFAPRRHERTIVAPNKVFGLMKKSLGVAGVLAVINLPLEAIDKVIPKSQQKGLVVEERSGWRKLDVVALQPPAPQKAA